MGRVRIGRGNNGRDGTEGVIYKHAVGCYLHGSLLPKNPVLADWLIAAGIGRERGLIELPPLLDDLEVVAHAAAVARAVKTR
jgi:CobQ-like glutamine amidotransferase family enzyme